MGAESWDRVVARSPMPSPFMRWAWHQAWAESAPSHEVDAAFAVALFGAEGNVEALIPMSVRQVLFRRTQARALGWAIDGVGAPDHLDIPVVPGASLDAVLPLVEGLPWDVMILDNVAADAPGVVQLSSALRRRGLSVRHMATEPCPYLDLPADWDAYLATLSPSRRETIRRKERRLRRQHAVSVTDYVPERLDDGWRLLHTLHAQRWEGGGVLADPRLDHLLRRFTSELAARDEVWLTTLDVEGVPVAAWYGFAWNDTVYFYQSGRDPRWEPASVGLVLMAVMIRRAIDRGYRRFDFLRGREAYKLSWTSTERLNYEVVAFRRGWRGGFLRGLDLMGRARTRLLTTPAADRSLSDSPTDARSAVDAHRDAAHEAGGA
jgi:CelD/BcsL family acetyltransferase involved in cellulose biosynthesis